MPVNLKVESPGQGQLSLLRNPCSHGKDQGTMVCFMPPKASGRGRGSQCAVIFFSLLLLCSREVIGNVRRVQSRTVLGARWTSWMFKIWLSLAVCAFHLLNLGILDPDAL